MFRKIDANSDGSVDWNELTQFMLMENKGQKDMQRGTVSFVRNQWMGEQNNHLQHREMIESFIFISKEGEDSLTAKTRKDLSLSTSSAPPSVSSPSFSSSLLSASAASAAPSSLSSSGFSSVSPSLSSSSFDNSSDKNIVRYVTGSRDGLIKFWNPIDLTHIHTIRHQGKGPTQAWVNAMAYLPNSNRLAVCSMDRVVTFYDPFTFKAQSRIRDTGFNRKQLECAPICMDAASIHDGREEVLMIGDDGGNLLVYTMKQKDWHICDGRGEGLVCRHSQHKHNANNTHWKHVELSRLSGLHDDWITKVKYDPRLNMVLTASLDCTIKQCDINKIDSTLGCVKRTYNGAAFFYNSVMSHNLSCHMHIHMFYFLSLSPSVSDLFCFHMWK